MSFSEDSGDGGLGPVVPGFDVPTQQLINTVRMYLRDYPELNRLIQGVEHSDRMIAWAIADAIDDWNSTPPLIPAIQLQNVPSKSLLLRGIVISLLESIGLLMTRNHLTFSDGGIQVGVSDKTPLIQSWLQLIGNRYEEKKQKLKIAINIELGWGQGLHSEYLWTNGFYGGW
jgi:hypothetical protein